MKITVEKNQIVNILKFSLLILLFFTFFFFSPKAYAGSGIYTTSTTTLNWDSFTGTTVSLGDDDISSAITIPFDFTFYGNTYNQLVISSNGFISFNANLGSDGCCGGENLPGSSINNIIAGWWTDLYPPGNGTIQYTTLGTAPNRRFIIQFSGIPECCGSTPDVSFEIKLFETSNNIEIHYSGTSSTPGNTVSAGIQDDTGNLGMADIDSVYEPTKINTATRYSYTAATNPVILNPAVTNIDSITASLSADFNDGGSPTEGYFLWGTQNTGCQNLPNQIYGDYFSDGNLHVLSGTMDGLTPGNTYYYCVAGFSGIGVSYSTVNSFIQDGPGKCLANGPNTDYTVSSSCSFGASIDGVDKGAGLTNNAVLTLDKGKTLTIASNQQIAYGILYMPGASIVKFTGGSIVRGAVWVPDNDGDNVPYAGDTAYQVISNTQPAGYMRRSLTTPGRVDCDDQDSTLWQLLQGATDADGDGYTALTYTQPVCSGSALPTAYSAIATTLDCNDSNNNVYRNVASLASDADQDGYYTGAGSVVCVGDTQNISSRSYYKNTSGANSYLLTTTALGSADCDDTSTLLYRDISIYPDFDGDGYTGAGVTQCIGASPPAGYSLVSNGNDCIDTNATRWQNLTGYPDTDSDSVKSYGYMTFCTGNSLPSGFSSTGGSDCNDSNASLSSAKTNVSKIDVGFDSACILLTNGTVQCWGYNYYGELGNGTTTNSFTPVNVSGISTATKVTSGDYFNCALLSNSTIQCWGENDGEELGNGTQTSSPPYGLTTPVSVSGISTATDVDAGAGSSCAVLSNGTVQCWGDGSNGALGDGTYNSSSTPVSVTGINNATQVSAGSYFACARLSDGTVKCWGYNGSGQLGNSTTTDSPSPVTVTGITNAVQVSAGLSVACAVLSDNSVKCWGYNDYGALGDGTWNSSSSPVTVSGITNASKVSVSGDENWTQHVCAKLTNGQIKCWGDGYDGELGNDDDNESNVPVTVLDMTSASDVAVNNYVSCAVLSDGRAQCWGDKYNGTIGNGSMVYASSPVNAYNVSNVSSVYTFGGSSCVILTTGAVQCWGSNSLGQLGNGTVRDSSVALDVESISTATKVVGNNNSTMCALLSGGTVKCWGSNGYGQLGNGTATDSSVPVSVTGLSSVTDISIGRYHSCARISDGTVKCWGYNYYGQLGNGTTSDSLTPVSVSGITNAAKVSVTDYYSCATLSTGAVKCWGYNYYGQLGNGTTSTSSPYGSSTPVSVSGISTATQVNASSNNACALLSDGSIKCWGYNGSGQLGNGTTTDSSTPVSVTGISTATQIDIYDSLVCSRLSDSTVKCWGFGGNGNLGNGSTSSSSTPVSVSGISTATQVYVGSYTPCALLSNGTIQCWGRGSTGMLGNGAILNATTPVSVSGISTATQMNMTPSHTCARLSSGLVKCWGSEYGGQLGDASQLGYKPDSFVCQ